MTGEPAGVPPIRSDRLELVAMSARFIELLVARRRAEAGSLGGIAVPDGWPDEHDARFLRLRAEQLRKDPRGPSGRSGPSPSPGKGGR